MELSVVHPSEPQSGQGSTGRPVPRGKVGGAIRVAQFDVPVPLELGAPGTVVRASAVGDPANSPVVVLGGISANAFPCLRPDGSAGWWPGLAGEGCAVDPRRHYVIGFDFAADPAGRVAPSTFDQARVLAAALDAVGVQRPCTIVGASYGGMVALALAQAEPRRVRQLVVISAGARPHPVATAARDLQRRVVSLGIEAGRGDEALAIARGMAMLTYRTPVEFGERFAGGIDASCPRSGSQPGTYLRARGEAFRAVMSPERFLSLSASIDRHQVDASLITAPALLIGATSDQLVYPGQMRELADALGGPAELQLLDSRFGHDMFLKEAPRIGKLAGPVLESLA